MVNPVVARSQMTDSNVERFRAEYEFVQLLANPDYLHYLATQDYFKDPRFCKYLKYLLYWKRPEYSTFLVYPHCLFFLEMLQDEDFRRELVQPEFVEYVRSQQYYHYVNKNGNPLSAEGTESTTDARVKAEVDDPKS